MFYSHEILTSRKHGVATIWLMATLGSKSTHKKVTRRAILDVDLPKACETISEPQLPLALRLQGSLLFGISRVFGQQCEYMKADIENLVVKIQGRPLHARHAQIDRPAETSRPEQLNLADDPAFDLDLAVGFDLTMFGLSEESSVGFATTSHDQPKSSQSSFQVLDDVIDEQLWVQFGSPYHGGSSLPSIGEGNEQQFTSRAGTDTMPGFDLAGQQAIFDDGDILITDDGSLVFNDLLLPAMSFADSDAPGGFAGSTGANRDLGADGAADDPFIPVDSAQAVGVEPTQSPDIGLAVIGEQVMTEHPDVTPDVYTTAEHTAEHTAAEAPHRGRGPTKPSKPDLIAELDNRQLSEWNSTYLQYISRTHGAKRHDRSMAQAKRNAAFWVLDQGIGGVQVNFGDDLETHPLAVLSGHMLLGLLKGTGRTLKRSRSASSTDEDEAERPKGRQRSNEAESGGQSGGRVMVDTDDGMMPLPSDYQPESEVGRQAPSSLKDHSSRMPWNVSSSRGSTRPYGSALHQASSVFGSAGGFHLGPPPDAQRFRRRLTSASPLMGRGRPLSHSEGLNEASGDGLTLDVDAFDDLGEPPGGSPDHILRDDQPNLVGGRLADILETETLNFLTFLDEHIRSRAAAAGDGSPANVTYEALLAPQHTSCVVATQGFVNLLTLATQDLIRLTQPEHFGSITISVAH